MERTRRLGELVALQRRLLAVHESRHAGHLAAVEAARAEVADLKSRADGDQSLSAIFPGLYSRRIDAALKRGEIARARADLEAKEIAAATLRTQRVEEAYRAARDADDRKRQERETLEAIEVRLHLTQ